MYSILQVQTQGGLNPRILEDATPNAKIYLTHQRSVLFTDQYRRKIHNVTNKYDTKIHIADRALQPAHPGLPIPGRLHRLGISVTRKSV